MSWNYENSATNYRLIVLNSRWPKSIIRLHFKDGISSLEIATLPALIQHLEESQGCSLRLVKINDDAGGAIVELAIENEDDKSLEQVKQIQAALEKEAQRSVEYQRLALVEKEKVIS